MIPQVPVAIRRTGYMVARREGTELKAVGYGLDMKDVRTIIRNKRWIFKTGMITCILCMVENGKG